MQALTVTEEVVLNTTRFFRSYASVPDGTEADVDKILVDVYGEARLLCETLKKKAETRGESVAVETTEDGGEKPTGLLFSREENIVAWAHSPARLGRVSSKFVGDGLYTHEETEVLPAQLKVLQERKPTKQHFRFAVVNGFGSNLGDNIIGMTAFRVIAECLERHFQHFSVDILFGPDNNLANADIVGYEPWVDQVLFQGPNLVEFAQYDAYFDVSGLITLPKFNEMPTVDWYLWWFGLDPKQVAPEKKRNKGYIRWDAWNHVHALLKDIRGKKILFNPKASVPLRSMPTEVASKFAKRLLELDPEMKLVVDQPISLKHNRLIDLSGKIDSPEKFKALVGQVDGVITVNSLASHFADCCSQPTIHICSCLPVGLYPYYPYSSGVNLKDYQKLPAYKKCKVSEQDWVNIAKVYQSAWETVSAKEILKLLNTKIVQRQEVTPAEMRRPEVVSERKASSCIETRGAISFLKRQRVTDECLCAQKRLPALAQSVLKAGARCVLAGSGSAAPALSLATQILPIGELIIFEPRRLLAQCLSGALIRVGLYNANIHPLMPVGEVKQANFPDLEPWTESISSEWGNCRKSVSVGAKSIDSLQLDYVHCLIIQPPMPFAKVLEGGIETLKKCRPLVLISPISVEDAGPASKVLMSANYTIWAESSIPGQGMERMLLLGIPSEQDIAIEGFMKIEVGDE